MKTRWSIIWVTSSLLLPVYLVSQSSLEPRPHQFTVADYSGANQFDPVVGRTLRNKVKNAFVVPHWVRSQDQFWYRRETAKGYEFVVVDAASGQGRPAFDHQSLAEAFSKASGSNTKAESLPFEDLTFSADLSSVRVKYENKEFECKLQPAACDSGKPLPPPPLDVSFLSSDTTLPAADPSEGLLISPDKRWAVFTRNNNLWLRDMTTQQDQQLTHDGVEHFGYGSYTGGDESAAIPREKALEAGRHLPPMSSYWSPDSRTVIVPRADERFVPDYPYVESAPADGSFRPKLHLVRTALLGEKGPALEWFAFDVPSGSFRRIGFPYDKLDQDIYGSDHPVRSKWWSADGRHLYALIADEFMRTAFLFDVDVSTGNVRTMLQETMLPRMETSPAPSWNFPVVWVSPEGKDVIWYSERDGWGHLYLYDGQTGKLRNQITRGDWLVRDIVKVDPERQRIFFTGLGREAGNPYYRYLYRVNFDGSGLMLLSPEHADHMIVGQQSWWLQQEWIEGYDPLSPTGKFVVYNFSTPGEPPQTVIRSTSDARPIATVEKSDASELFAMRYRPPEDFVAKAADGKTDLWSIIYKPSDFEPTRRYPVIDLEYAIPATAVVPRNFLNAVEGQIVYPTGPMLAELGFIVITIDARGTPYRSRAFSQYGFGQDHIRGLDDHVAVIKQLGERFNYADMTRVAIVGQSDGGRSAVLAMLDFPGFFRVGIAENPALGLDDSVAYQGPPVYSDGSHVRPTANEVPENWKELDLRRKAANLKGHLLIMTSELDENCIPASTNQFLNALMEADRDFDLVYLTGASHSGLWTTYRKYYVRHVYDYLVRYLMGAEPPGQ